MVMMMRIPPTAVTVHLTTGIASNGSWISSFNVDAVSLSISATLKCKKEISVINNTVDKKTVDYNVGNQAISTLFLSILD